jgi:hypothetical protein
MNNGAWTPEQIEFVKNNYTTMTIEEMADTLIKSYAAVQQFMHRHRLAIPSVKRNVILELLKMKFTNPSYFTPNKSFYEAIGLTTARWWDLYYGRKAPTPEEYVIIATHFNVSIQEAFDSRQLSIFDTEEK